MHDTCHCATTGSELVSDRDPSPLTQRSWVPALRSHPSPPPLALRGWSRLGWGSFALTPQGAAGGRGERPPSPAPRMTGAGEPRREEPPPPSAGLRSRESGARSAGGWERAERGRGAAARPATGPPPRRIGPLYGMWLVTFLLLLDSLHKGETARAAGRPRRRGRGARSRRRGGVPGGCPAGSRCPEDRPRCVAPGGRSGVEQAPAKGRVRVRLGPLRPPPAPAFRGAPVGAVTEEALVSRLPAGRSSAPGPSPSPLPASCGLLVLGPRGALRVGVLRP